MLKELCYPFDAEYILKKKKSLKKTLLAGEDAFIDKRIAILGGSTTSEVKNILELFLLNQGIRPEFYESEYNQYFQDAMFPDDTLLNFKPDIVYLHTTNRNIVTYPELNMTEQDVDTLIENEFEKYQSIWNNLSRLYNCVIIQNNFEMPYVRLLGNRDAFDIHGNVNYLSRLNMKFYEYARSSENFYINDINYVSALYGLEAWSDPFFWHMYKYAMCLTAIPSLAYNLSNIVKSIYGKNKKALVMDLDNTMWGGVVGDDGVDNLELGQETSIGQAYSEFQGYIKNHKQLGVLLCVNSKNDMNNALDGLAHPESVVSKEDFIVIKANWEPKNSNITEIAKELNILPESMVFVDDNPAEREIVSGNIAGIGVPEISRIEYYIREIDRNAYFEVTTFSQDDQKRNEMYKENQKRQLVQSTFTDYSQYLESLEMKAQNKPFDAVSMSRIAQLTNKSNQFNLTTKRYSQSEIEKVSEDPNYIKLYGRLEDKFGDNGIVSVVIGKKDSNKLHIDLWIMSCRVLKRDMEFAMMDSLVKQCMQYGIDEMYGYYYPTKKNGMVKDFYQMQGFELVSEDEEGNTVWSFNIGSNYNNKNKFIKVED